MEVDEKSKVYSLTLLKDLRGREGQVKVTGRNGGGEDSCASQLTIGGRAPEFIEKPLKCTVLDGTCRVFFSCPRLHLYILFQWVCVQTVPVTDHSLFSVKQPAADVLRCLPTGSTRGQQEGFDEVTLSLSLTQKGPFLQWNAQSAVTTCKNHKIFPLCAQKVAFPGP